jgi:hypothetical protein
VADAQVGDNDFVSDTIVYLSQRGGRYHRPPEQRGAACFLTMILKTSMIFS